MLRIALITNHPPPFRIPVYERIARIPCVDLQAIFCSPREPNRQWELPPLRFDHTFLKERFVTRGSNFIHNNPDVVTALRELSPHVVVTTGFNPTFLYAFGYAIAAGVPHVPMTDGTDASEESLSRWHKAIRRVVYARSRAFIAASHGGLRLYDGYGVPDRACFLSCLCTDNHAFAHAVGQKKRFDLIFCGRMVPEKNPLFSLQVAASLTTRLGRRSSILFVGSGLQEEDARKEALRLSAHVDAHFHGHAAQDELPALYGSARLFLFPTLRDVWGVVANEACAAGLPVIVSPHAGVVGELVVDGRNGFVSPLDIECWAEQAARLLTDDAMYCNFSASSRALAGHFTFDHAAAGIVEACRYAAGWLDKKPLGTVSRKTG